MRICDNGTYREMTPDEVSDFNKKVFALLSESEVFKLFAKQYISTLAVDDNTALRMRSYYPTWQELIAKQFTAKEAGFKFTYGDDLYKTIPPDQQFLPNWIPGQGTESIFERIDETHAGTKEDPIPYKVNMEVFKDKYYIEEGILYICTRNSEQPLQNKVSELVGHYFEVVEE